jgi:hypothetical protein
MSATKVALAGLAALAGPMMYVADPVRPGRPPPVSAPPTLAQMAERPAPVHTVRPGVRVILASPYDPPGTKQEAAATSPSPGVPEFLYAREETPPAAPIRVAAAAAGDKIVVKSRKKVRTASRAKRARPQGGVLQATSFFAWLR